MNAAKNCLITLLLLILIVLSGSVVPAATTPAPANGALTEKVVPIDPVGARKMVIDGSLDEWGIDARRSVVLDELLDRDHGGGWPIPHHAAAMRLLYDDQALYVGVRVVDPSRVRDVASPYDADAVELFIDVRPIAPADGPKCGDAAYSAGVYQLAFTAPAVEGGVIDWLQSNKGQRNIGQLDVAGKNTDDGYTLEMRIPYASLGIDAARLTSGIGFSVNIDDADKDADGATTPTVQYVWNHGGAWNNAAIFGRAMPDAPVTAVPYLRCFVPKLLEMAGLRLLATGAVMPGDAPETADRCELTLKWSATADDALTSNVPFSEKRELVNYPQLGARVIRQVAELDSLHKGHYAATATIGGATTVNGAFDTLSWQKMPSLPPAHPDAVRPGVTADAGTILHNGWKITPAGRMLPLPGDMPLKLFFTPDGRYLLANSAGFHDQGIYVIDPVSLKIVDKVAPGNIWAGLCLMPNGHDLYASAGACKRSGKDGPPLQKNAVRHFTLDNGKLQALPSLDLPALGPEPAYIAGIASGPDGSLYVVDMNNDSLYRLAGDPLTVQASAHLPFCPYMPALSQNGKVLAVSNWGDATVSLLDPKTLDVVSNIKAGSHPNELTFSAQGSLYVANAGSNSVSIGSAGPYIDETVTTSLDPADPVGSTPDAVAVSPDGKRLYVANADNNDVAVVDVSKPQESQVLGFIPTGWYPSALTVSPDGKQLYIGIGKGYQPHNTADGTYIANTLAGALEVVDVSNLDHLAKWTWQVAANSPWRKPWAGSKSTAKEAQRAFAQIKHVLYIIRENRTYDQVFGDIAGGNGDPRLTMFGADVTPNAHALAHDYVLLDNLYCNGEVSEDGHQWCNAAYATDFTEKAWINSYSGRGEPDADDRLTESPGGYLWDNCARHGLSYRSYGEFAGFTANKDAPPHYHGMATLKGHASPNYHPWDTRDTVCAGVFIDELHAAEKSGQWPNYMVMTLPEDHTRGLSPGAFTPVASVASNDQALGKIVEAISHSRFWKDTAIFVIEDDAQDGCDHVDAHRTVGLVISPYTQRRAIDSTFYTTSSMVRTMEEILKLPNMTQYDGGATPLYRSFSATPVLTPFTCRPPLVDLLATNPKDTAAAIKSSSLDFSAPDRVDPHVLNELLWAAWQPDIPMPPSVHSSLVIR